MAIKTFPTILISLFIFLILSFQTTFAAFLSTGGKFVSPPIPCLFPPISALGFVLTTRGTVEPHVFSFIPPIQKAKFLPPIPGAQVVTKSLPFGVCFIPIPVPPFLIPIPGFQSIQHGTSF